MLLSDRSTIAYLGMTDAHIGMFVIDSNTTESEVKEYVGDWLHDPRVRENETPLIIVRSKADLYGPNPVFMADKAFILNYLHSSYGAVRALTLDLQIMAYIFNFSSPSSLG